ncbi:MAG: flagellin [Pseudomonadota bacterium]
MAASILTNSSAMIALQTLRSTNNQLADVNNQISTGKKVATAKDNAAVFAISEVMESDVAGFQAVSESLSLGESTVAVASNAANEIGNILNEIKGRIVAANEDNVDRQSLQNEIVSLRDQISSIVSSAQFNGLNLIDGSNDGAGGFSVLSSLDRDSSGSVTTNSITFDPTGTNLSSASGTDLVNNGAAVVTFGGNNVAAFDPAGGDVLDAGLTSAQIAADATKTGFGLEAVGGDDDFSLAAFIPLDAAGAAAAGAAALSAEDVDLVGGAPDDGVIAGDKITVGVGNTVATYTVIEGDRTEDIAAGLRTALVEAGIDQDVFQLDTNATAGGLTVNNLSAQQVNGFYQVTRASGGLAGLDAINVSTAAGAAAAVSQIEGFIQNAVDAQAQLGTTEKRLEIQGDFMSTLIDSFKAGIGGLVDADLEEASARLQSLQVQQQLGVQALSIANQAPQNILALFR